MKRVKFMYEYQCWPLWHMDYDIDGEMGDIDPSLLPISEHLLEGIRISTQTYDKTLHKGDPMRSGFETVEEAKQFLDQACYLLSSLKRELGESFDVISILPEKPADLVRSLG